MAGTTQASMSGNTTPGYVADITGDYAVDLADFVMMSSQWLDSPGDPSTDIAPPPDGDGVVNIDDLILLAENWLWGI
ncbi:MAG: hypothetical protein JW860_11005 [Sedimentisphaerales bacterium]|nr:hypothetical protein [Sedimentisphaerales bacterium]